MIQVADTGVGISGQEGMQVVYPKTAANEVRFCFKPVQSVLWRLNSSTVCFLTWAKLCSPSFTPRPQLLIPPGAIRSWMLQVKLQTIVCYCSLSPAAAGISELHITPVMQGNEQPKCQCQWFLCSDLLCGNNDDSHIPAWVVLDWALCVSCKVLYGRGYLREDNLASTMYKKS